MFHWPNRTSLVPWENGSRFRQHLLVVYEVPQACDGDQLALGDRHGEQPYLTQESPRTHVAQAYGV